MATSKAADKGKYSSLPTADVPAATATLDRDEEVGSPESTNDELTGLVENERSPPSPKKLSAGNKKGNRPMRRIRVRHQHPSHLQQQPRNSFMLRLTCLSVVTLVVLGCVGLLTYLEDKSKPTYEYVPADSSGGDIPYDDDQGGFDLLGSTERGSARGWASPAVEYQALQQLMDLAGVSDISKRTPQTVRYNPNPSLSSPLDFSISPSSPLKPLLPDITSTQDIPGKSLGYIRYPDIVNNQLVFCSQGDAFITSLEDSGKGAFSATKLTTTVGNVLDPKLHPNLRYVAYTATYTAHREVYLLDLQGGTPALRITYWDIDSGVDGLIGWWGENALVFRARSNEVSLRDMRLYVVYLDNLHPESNEATNKQVSVLQIDPIPLSQARDAARLGTCWYFVRVSQSSHTMRYVGGTAEKILRYCDGDDKTSRFLDGDNYRGTSKSPQVYPKSNYLFFLSDRGPTTSDDGKLRWRPDRMNVWAAPLGDPDPDAAGTVHKLPSQEDLIQITDTTCDFEGRVIQEYSIDSTTGNMVLRIGADLYVMEAAAIQAKLQTGRELRQLNEVDKAPSERPNQGSNAEPTLTSAMEDFDDGLPFNENITTFDDGDNDVEMTIEDGDTMIMGNATATDDTNTTMTEPVVEVSKVYYHYEAPFVLDGRVTADEGTDHVTGTSEDMTRLPIVVHSDFHTHQERLIPVDILSQMTSGDVFESTVGTQQFIMTLRGQLFVAPIVEDTIPAYREMGQNLPARRYRLAPGSKMGGVVRILGVRHVPNPVEDDTSERRLAVILATDPLTETGEHAFYLIESHASATPVFIDYDKLPKPFLGGHVSGGSSKAGGLGSVVQESWTISPCGRRMAWTDKDGRIAVMNLPQYQEMTSKGVAKSTILPTENEVGEPMQGDDEAQLTFSPGGRYLAITHNARNQFSIISVVDLGDPRGEDRVADIEVGRIVQATPNHFNSKDPFWGKSSSDMHIFTRESGLAALLGKEPPADVATTLYFLSDRDIRSDVSSPWGTRQPSPHFPKLRALFALPLSPTNSIEPLEGPFAGGAATELQVDAVVSRMNALKAVATATGRARRRLSRTLHDPLSGAFSLAQNAFKDLPVRRRNEEKPSESERDVVGDESDSTNDGLREAAFPEDMDIDFGPESDRSLAFARQAYRLSNIPESKYISLVSQTQDNGSFILVEEQPNGKAAIVLFSADSYPSDTYKDSTFTPVSRDLASYGRSTSGDYIFLGFSPDGQFTVVPNVASSFSALMADVVLDHNIVSSSGLYLSVWPTLEYRQIYDDAWRMLRDYFYDPDMTGIDWETIHGRYLPLVSRCAKREELDDVLSQMASELSALHVFVYGGEYDAPFYSERGIKAAHSMASLGAVLQRSPEWNGYEILSIPESDPDFSVVDQKSQVYSPLSDRTLRLSGQKGLEVGDIIVGVNGESVMSVPDIHMMLRGMAGQSVRLDVLRTAAMSATENSEAIVEPVITVPITSSKADDLLYSAWEWKTKQLAQSLAEKAGFSVGYVHLQSMSGPQAEDAFARGFFPDYDKEAFILDVRHNRGGNIDSWVLDVLQRKAWMYWQSRDYGIDNGGLGWDEQFAFRGHIVVLIDEKTSSDGEGVSRGISELGLGRLIGTRTWGGGIWLASDNILVDGGLASAPEIGTYNDNFGWGLGIENMGVDPDVVVDNDPHRSYTGEDDQLVRAIAVLEQWLKEEPIVTPKPPTKKRDVTMGDRECQA